MTTHESNSPGSFTVQTFIRLTFTSFLVIMAFYSRLLHCSSSNIHDIPISLNWITLKHRLIKELPFKFMILQPTLPPPHCDSSNNKKSNAPVFRFTPYSQAPSTNEWNIWGNTWLNTVNLWNPTVSHDHLFMWKQIIANYFQGRYQSVSRVQEISLRMWCITKDDDALLVLIRLIMHSVRRTHMTYSSFSLGESSLCGIPDDYLRIINSHLANKILIRGGRLQLWANERDRM